MRLPTCPRSKSLAPKHRKKTTSRLESTALVRSTRSSIRGFVPHLPFPTTFRYKIAHILLVQLPGEGRRSRCGQRRSTNNHSQRTVNSTSSSKTSSSRCALIWCPRTRPFTGSTSLNKDDQETYQQFSRTRSFTRPMCCSTYRQNNKAKRCRWPRSTIQRSWRYICCNKNKRKQRCWPRQGQVCSCRSCYDKQDWQAKQQCTWLLLTVQRPCYFTSKPRYWKSCRTFRTREFESAGERASIRQHESRFEFALAHCWVCARGFKKGEQGQKRFVSDIPQRTRPTGSSLAGSAPRYGYCLEFPGVRDACQRIFYPQPTSQKSAKFQICSQTRNYPPASIAWAPAVSRYSVHDADYWVKASLGLTTSALATIGFCNGHSGPFKWTGFAVDCQRSWWPAFKRHIHDIWSLAFVVWNVFCLTI